MTPQKCFSTIGQVELMSKHFWYERPLRRDGEEVLASDGSFETECCRWQMKRGWKGAAVEKNEDMRKPDVFFGNRKSKELIYNIIYL